jgi:probable O-glycosylation ligase (exosortase A-associated)
MRDLFMLGVLALLFLAAFKRPFVMTLGYLYVDIVQPHEVSWYLLNSVPVSLIFAVSAVLFYLLFDDKRHTAFGLLQGLMLLFLGWITLSTSMAMIPEVAWIKWDAAWKAIAFGIFLPFVLQTRQRFEAAMLFIVLSVGVLTIGGGIKTLLGGGGYGTLSLLVDRNSGLYEGSTISAVAITVIPLILYLYSHNTIVPRNRLTWLLTAGLIFAALLIPVGTEARTGLVCIAVLAGLLLLRAKRKMVYAAGVAVLAVVAVPFLPDTFTGRMTTIKAHETDASASTRLAVWDWTLDFVNENPLGGGFGVYRLNEIEFEVVRRSGEGPVTAVETVTVTDRARAFHSSYFEVLGETGYPGLAIFLSMLALALVQLRGVFKRFKDSVENHWLADASRAVGFAIVIYMVGQLFVGLGFQSMLYHLLALSVALTQIAARTAAPTSKPIEVTARFAKVAS